MAKKLGKRLTVILMTLAMVVALLPAVTITASAAAVTGSEDKPSAPTLTAASTEVTVRFDVPLYYKYVPTATSSYTISTADVPGGTTGLSTYCFLYDDPSGSVALAQDGGLGGHASVTYTLTGNVPYYIGLLNEDCPSVSCLLNITAEAAPNTAPTFVQAGDGSLTVNQDSGATDIKGLLHVNDTDAGQPLIWSENVAPNHGGTLSFTGATAFSGTADVTPGGTILYTPAAGYTGTETFTVQVYDGTATATRTINVTVSTPTPFYVGNALRYADADDVLSAPYLTGQLDNITMEAWVKADTIASNNIRIMYNGDSGNSGYGIYLDVNKQPCVLVGGVGWPTVEAVSLNTSQWYHLAAVRNNGVWMFYINGTAYVPTNSTLAPSALAPGNEFTIGNRPHANENFTGSIDEVRFWTVARTGQQIRDNMYIKLQGNEAGLLAYYNFDQPGITAGGDNTGVSSVTDVAGGNQNLDITGFARSGDTSNFVQSVNMGTFQLGNAAYSVGESEGQLTIPIVRTGGSEGSVTLSYTTANGTAAAGTNYTATSGSVTFAQGETVKNIQVPVLNQHIVAPLTFTFSISAQYGVSVGPVTSTTVTILNDTTTFDFEAATVPDADASTSAATATQTVNGETISIAATGGAFVVGGEWEILGDFYNEFSGNCVGADIYSAPSTMVRISLQGGKSFNLNTFSIFDFYNGDHNPNTITMTSSSGATYNAGAAINYGGTDHGEAAIDVSANPGFKNITYVDFTASGAGMQLAFDDICLTNIRALPSTDASLASVAGQIDGAPAGGNGLGTGTAVTWSVSVPNATAALGRVGIAVAANATFNLYSDAAFGTEVTGADTIALTSGGATTVYIKVTAQDTTTAKYYAVTVNRAPAAPVIEHLNGDSATYLEGGTAVLLDNGADAAVSDSDSADFNGGTVTASITGNRVPGEDVLGVRNIGTGAGQIGISGTDVTYGGTTIGTVSGGTGTNDLVITLNGNATLAATSALLRALTYQNTNGTEPDTAARTVTVTVSDGDGGTSAGAAVTVAVTGVNDAPTATVTALSPTFTAGGAAVRLFDCPSVGTVEASQKIRQIIVTVSNVTDGSHEILYSDGTNVALTNGNLVTTTSGIVCAVSVAAGTATVTFTKAGNIPASGAGGADGLITWLCYRNISAVPTPANRVVTLISMSDDGGMANGGADTTTLNIASTVTVLGDTAAPTVSVTAGMTAGGDALVNSAEKAAGFSVVAQSSEASGTLYVVPAGTANNSVAITGAALGSAAPAGANTNTTIAVAAGHAGVVDGTSYAVYAVDAAGNISDISAAAFTADLTVPTVTSVSVPANGAYKAGQTLSFTVSFNEAVTKTVANPLLRIDIGGSVVNAAYTGGSGTSALTFSYTVVNETDTNGISVISPLDQNGCTITDAAGNSMTDFSLNNVGSTAGVLVDTTAPTVVSVTVPANAAYVGGENLDFTVYFDEAVTVNTAGGTPRLSLVIGATTRYADYQSGTGTSALVFRYTVQSGDSDSNGIAVGGVLDANGGTLQDAAANSAVLTLNSVGSTASVLVDALVRMVELSVDNASITENGGTATVTATLSAASYQDVTVTLGYTGTATGGGTDYTTSGTTITITAGNTTGTATVTAVSDTADEPDETVIADITGVTNATESGTQQVTVTITDDDAPPSLSVSDPSVAEGNSGTASLTFTVTLSVASGKTVTVEYATADGTATSGSDYTAKSGTLTFAPGETTKTVTVTVTGDTTTEASETVLLNLSGAVNATISDNQGSGTITNDDTPPPPPPPPETGGSTGGSTGGNTGGNTGGSTNTNVEVNGTSYSAGTTESTTNGQGQSVTTVTVDTDRLEDILESQGQGAVVTIPVAADTDIAAGVLTGAMVDTMEDIGATLVIATENATYTLPASEINIGAISQQFGSGVSLADITVTVSVSAPSSGMVRVVENAASDGGYTLVVPAVEFTVSCTYGEQTVDVTSFNAYVDRTITIPDGVDPNQITTAVVVGPDGTSYPVPTEIVYDTATGHYVAVIHSLTNSVYTVIYNPVAFADVTTHWAKDAINNMGSRLVLTGVGDNNFAPDRDITRAEFAAIVVRALGLKPGLGKSAFSDVKAADWYAGYVGTAVSYGLITGYANGTFGPNDRITREQALTILARAMKLTGLEVSLGSGEAAAILGTFADGGSVSGYAADGVAACVKAGVLTGKSGAQLAAADEITRAEVAVMIERLLQLSELI